MRSLWRFARLPTVLETRPATGDAAHHRGQPPEQRSIDQPDDVAAAVAAPASRLHLEFPFDSLAHMVIVWSNAAPLVSVGGEQVGWLADVCGISSHYLSDRHKARAGRQVVEQIEMPAGRADQSTAAIDRGNRSAVFNVPAPAAEACLAHNGPSSFVVDGISALGAIRVTFPARPCDPGRLNTTLRRLATG
jgi:hypothetical protein